MGGRTPQKKIDFLPENGGFWCILGLLFTFMQKLAVPAPSWIRHCEELRHGSDSANTI